MRRFLGDTLLRRGSQGSAALPFPLASLVLGFSPPASSLGAPPHALFTIYLSSRAGTAPVRAMAVSQSKPTTGTPHSFALSNFTPVPDGQSKCVE